MPGQATEGHAPEFDRRPALLSSKDRTRVMEAVRDPGRRLDSLPHHRLQGRPEFRPRAGDCRVICRLDPRLNIIELVTVGHRREIDR